MASALNVTTLAAIFIVVIFAVITQLLAANGSISLSTTLQLTMWLVALGFIVLLAIAYMFFRLYEAATRSEETSAEKDATWRDTERLEPYSGEAADEVKHLRAPQLKGADEAGRRETYTGKDEAEQERAAQMKGADEAGRRETYAGKDEAERERAAVVAAEEWLAKAIAKKAAAEQEAKVARDRADTAGDDAEKAADEAERARTALMDAEERLVKARAAEEITDWRRAHRAA